MQKFSIHTHGITLHQEKNRTYIKTWNERDYTSLTGYYDNINNVTYNLKQLILVTNKFRKDDVDILYASIDKRTSVYVTNNCYLRLEGNVAMILGFEAGANISNFLVTSPCLSLSTGNVSSLYDYTNIIHSQYVGDIKVPLLRIVGVEGQHGKSVTKTFGRPQYLSVCRQTRDTIEIDKKDDAGDSISLQHGKIGSKTSFQETAICLFLMIKMKSDNPYETYFVNQAKGEGYSQLRGSLSGFQGAQMQRGFGLGSLFRGFYHTALLFATTRTKFWEQHYWILVLILCKM